MWKSPAELIQAGTSDRADCPGGSSPYSALPWPPRSRWKQSIIGRSTDRTRTTSSFVRLAGRHIEQSREEGRSRWWCGAPGPPVDIYLYVLALADGCFYVGLTSGRRQQNGAHLPGRFGMGQATCSAAILHTICTGTKDGRAAELMEGRSHRHIDGSSWHREGARWSFPVIRSGLGRGHLRGHGRWERSGSAALKGSFNTEGKLGRRLDEFLELALRYYDAGAPADLHDAVFSACYRLTRYRYWHEDFAPGLSWQFWNRKGILPVLLSFKLGRPVGNRLASVYDVLAKEHSRAGRTGRTLCRLFLKTWQTYTPETTKNRCDGESVLGIPKRWEADRRYLRLNPISRNGICFGGCRLRTPSVKSD